MAGKRWKEEDIIVILRESQKGDVSIGETCRAHGISEATFYKWRKRYGGIEKTEIRKMKELEKENLELKKVLGEHVMMVNVLKEHLKKRGWD